MVLSSRHPSLAEQSDEREDVFAELKALLRSEHFRRSRQSSAFLQFVVEQTVQGNVHLLRERTIAIFAFRRFDDYDTSLDAFVRVRANDVRRRLASYYGCQGLGTQLRIELSPGTYVPKFVRARRESAQRPDQLRIPASLLAGKSSIHMSFDPLSVEMLNAALPILQLAFLTDVPVTFEHFDRIPKLDALGICMRVEPETPLPRLVVHREPAPRYVITGATADEVSRFTKKLVHRWMPRCPRS